MYACVGSIMRALIVSRPTRTHSETVACLGVFRSPAGSQGQSKPLAATTEMCHSQPSGDTA